MAEHTTDPGRRIAQRLLAREVTATVHGVEATEQAVQASAALFSGELDLQALPEMPTKSVARAEVLERPILDALLASGLASSKADARRGIEGRGFYLNGQAIDRVDAMLAGWVRRGGGLRGPGWVAKPRKPPPPGTAHATRTPVPITPRADPASGRSAQVEIPVTTYCAWSAGFSEASRRAARTARARSPAPLSARW
jgi:hypothetical protein